MSPGLEITFDCLPLRSIGRLDIPLDASPKFRERCLRLKEALAQHGSFNTYYLHNAQCLIRLTHSDEVGLLHFRFEGTVLTDESDRRTTNADLRIELVKETCDWLTEPVVHWFSETVRRAVMVEFDLYIAAGDLKKAVERIDRIQAESDSQGGYVGMYL